MKCAAFFLSSLLGAWILAAPAVADTFTFGDRISKECRADLKSQCYTELAKEMISEIDKVNEKDLARRLYTIYMLAKGDTEGALRQYDQLNGKFAKTFLSIDALSEGYFDFSRIVALSREDEERAAKTLSRLGVLSLERGDHSGAHTAFEGAIDKTAALKDKKKLILLYKLMANTYAKHNKLNQAKSYLSKISDDSWYFRTFAEITKTIIKDGQSDVAKQWISDLVKTAEKRGIQSRRSLPGTISQMYLDLGEIETARSVLRKFGQPESDSFNTSLSLILAKSGDFAGAYEAVDRIKFPAFTATARIEVAGEEYLQTQNTAALKIIEEAISKAMSGGFKEFYRWKILYEAIVALSYNDLSDRAYRTMDSISNTEYLYNIYSLLSTWLKHKNRYKQLNDFYIRETRPIAAGFNPEINFDWMKGQLALDNIKQNNFEGAFDVIKSIQDMKQTHKFNERIAERLAKKREPEQIVQNIMPTFRLAARNLSKKEEYLHVRSQIFLAQAYLNAGDPGAARRELDVAEGLKFDRPSVRPALIVKMASHIGHLYYSIEKAN